MMIGNTFFLCLCFKFLKFNNIFSFYRSNVHNRLGPRRRNIRGSGGNYRQTSSRNNRSQNYNNNKDANNRRSGDDFFKVTIPNGHKYEQAYIRQLLKENLDDMDDEIIFYNVSFI